MSFPYTLDASTGATATLGLIALQVDETIEGDARRLLPENVALHLSRIGSGENLTAETIATMETNLPHAAQMLPQAPRYDVVGYGCTSGTTLIGAAQVAALVRSGCQTAAVTDPLTAAIEVFRHLGVQSLGLVSPYIDDVSKPVRAAFVQAGFKVPHAVNFGEQVEANVVRISGTSVVEAARAVSKNVDAVFLSCTNLRTLDVIPALQADLGRPVISSNTALFWHMLSLAKLAPPAPLHLAENKQN